MTTYRMRSHDDVHCNDENRWPNVGRRIIGEKEGEVLEVVTGAKLCIP
jgi:hypothetical protein